MHPGEIYSGLQCVMRWGSSRWSYYIYKLKWAWSKHNLCRFPTVMSNLLFSLFSVLCIWHWKGLWYEFSDRKCKSAKYSCLLCIHIVSTSLVENCHLCLHQVLFCWKCDNFICLYLQNYKKELSLKFTILLYVNTSDISILKPIPSIAGWELLLCV